MNSQICYFCKKSYSRGYDEYQMCENCYQRSIYTEWQLSPIYREEELRKAEFKRTYDMRSSIKGEWEFYAEWIKSFGLHKDGLYQLKDIPWIDKALIQLLKSELNVILTEKNQLMYESNNKRLQIVEKK